MLHLLLTVSLSATFLLVSPCCAQVLPDYDLGGARKPKPDMSFRKENQYKRVHQAALRFVLHGEIAKSDSFLTGYLEDHPDDAETLYMLGVLNLQRGDVEEGEQFLRRSIQSGLPPGRLIAGPREMLKSAWTSKLLMELRAEHASRPVHGPLVGNTSASGLSVWVRTADETSVRLLVTETGQTGPIRTPAPVRSPPAEDYTAGAYH